MKSLIVFLTLTFNISTSYSAEIEHSYQPTGQQSTFDIKYAISNIKLKTITEHSIISHVNQMNFSYTYGLSNEFALGFTIPYVQRSLITNYHGLNEQNSISEGFDLIAVNFLGKSQYYQNIFYLSSAYQFQTIDAYANYDSSIHSVNEGQDRITIKAGYQYQTNSLTYGLELNQIIKLNGAITLTDQQVEEYMIISGGNVLEQKLYLSFNNKLQPTFTFSNKRGGQAKYKSTESEIVSYGVPINTIQLEVTATLQINQDFSIQPIIGYETLGIDRKNHPFLTDNQLYNLSTNLKYKF